MNVLEGDPCLAVETVCETCGFITVVSVCRYEVDTCVVTEVSVGVEKFCAYAPTVLSLTYC